MDIPVSYSTFHKCDFFYTVSIMPFRLFSSLIPLMNDVSSDLCLNTTSPLDVVGTASLAIVRPFVESVVNREGVCERDGAFEEQRDDGLDEFKFSKGISSEVGRKTRGLESLDFGVPECDRFLLPSRFGVPIGVLDFAEEELRCLDDSLK